MYARIHSFLDKKETRERSPKAARARTTRIALIGSAVPDRWSWVVAMALLYAHSDAYVSMHIRMCTSPIVSFARGLIIRETIRNLCTDPQETGRRERIRTRDPIENKTAHTWKSFEKNVNFIRDWLIQRPVCPRDKNWWVVTWHAQRSAIVFYLLLCYYLRYKNISRRYVTYEWNLIHWSISII